MRYCQSEPKLVFTRSRPYKKNDNAHVEQKNWTHVRKIFGWQRLAGECVAKAMNELYANELRLLMNYFQPSMKLIERRRVGSRVTKKYDAPQTPLDRLIALGALEGERKATMLAERAALNPFELAAGIERKVATILKMCEEQTLPAPCKRHGPPLLALSNRVVRVRRAAHGAR